MADDESPRPFRRERNLSNRNFRRNSQRRFSTEAHNSIGSSQTSNNSIPTTPAEYSPVCCDDTDSKFPLISVENSQNNKNENAQFEDPALLDVKQKVKRFETLQCHESVLHRSGLIKRIPSSKNSIISDQSRFLRQDYIEAGSTFQNSIDEERSEDEIDHDDEYSNTSDDLTVAQAQDYELQEEAKEMKENTTVSPIPVCMENSIYNDVHLNAHEFSIDDFGKVETIGRYDNNDGQAKLTSTLPTGALKVLDTSLETNKSKDFKRNYRSTPRPKTQILGAANFTVLKKFHSVYQENDDDEEVEAELRDKGSKCIQPILDELIKTEENYVENLDIGIRNYGNIFSRKDLPLGLRGKKYVLLGNIEQIAEFHRNQFLPMLHRNTRDLKQLFEEFQELLDQHCFYSYVIFTMNKQRSLKLCDLFKNYFKLIQTELDDKLGINSFLVQPIQRMARYPLLLTQFITTLFKNRDFVVKPLIESCCRLEKKLRAVLTATNESEVINDIVECHDFNVFYQGKFRKVSDFNVFDHTLKRSYRSKVFIFDKCIIYTEIKGKNLIYHGRFSCEHIGIVAKNKTFTLYYEKRKQQECDFTGPPHLIEQWIDLITEMVSLFAAEQRQKLQDMYSHSSDHMHRKPPSLSLYRDSNRFSSDSGLGNIWIMPKPEIDPEMLGNRSTWYTN